MLLRNLQPFMNILIIVSRENQDTSARTLSTEHKYSEENVEKAKKHLKESDELLRRLLRKFRKLDSNLICNPTLYS